ncbi:MAG: zinc ribbon domain-containing protein [Planctomycetes bacterium]|nr:zinc ribbon domain-containing protein [Planctomycetota bacterium]
MAMISCPHCGEPGDEVAIRAGGLCPHCGATAAGAAVPRPCPACGQENPSAHSFCQDCGQALRPELGTATGAGREAAIDRRLALIELDRGRRAVNRLRLCMLLVGLLAGLVAILQGLDHRAEAWTGWTAFFLSVLFGVGAVRVAREPMLWTVSLASLATVELVAGFTQFDLTALIIVGCGLLLVWSALPAAARLERVLRDFPELDQDLSPHQNEPALLRLRLLRDDRRRRRERRLLAGLVAIVLVVVIGIALLVTAPPDSDDARLAFERAWNEGDETALVALFGEDASARRRVALGRQLARRGWQRSRPKLPGLLETVTEENEIRLRYDLGLDGLEARFRLEDGGWRLLGLDLPHYEPPNPIDAVLAGFEKAWEQGDLVALASAWIEADRRDLLRGRFERELRERDWLPRPPPLGPRRIVAATELQQVVQHHVGGGILQTKWEYRHPDWLMRGLKFPE